MPVFMHFALELELGVGSCEGEPERGETASRTCPCYVLRFLLYILRCFSAFFLYIAHGKDRDRFRRIGRRRGVVARRRAEGPSAVSTSCLGKPTIYTPDQMEERAETRQLVNVFTPPAALASRNIGETPEPEAMDNRTGWNQKKFKVAWRLIARPRSWSWSLAYRSIL